MVASLKLVTSATLAVQQVNSFAVSASDVNESGEREILYIKGLAPKLNISARQVERPFSSKLLVVVLLIHIISLVWLNNVKPAATVIKVLQTPMTVSLISNHVPKADIVPLQQDEMQPVIKKQKPMAKQKMLTTDEAAKEPIVQDRVVKEQAAEQYEVAVAPVTAESVAKAAEPVLAEDAEPQKSEVEPVIEQPKFGAAYLNNPAPDYPQLARRLGEQGRVMLKVLVTESGQAERVHIEISSGYSKLDQAAVEAVKKWSFIPAKQSNQPISVYVLVPVKFTLNR